ncbi:TPA: hypothetical protein O8L76_001105 [Enterobacter asburiae]|nr:hypothetical protein [Enterobacter asburiae]
MLAISGLNRHSAASTHFSKTRTASGEHESVVAFFTPKHDFHLSVCLPSAPRKELLVNRFAIIAALPEPAYGPTHGLLSRRSTDRISTSPLANFAQLSMFRFDGLKITLVMSDGNNLIYKINHISYKLMITK